MLHREILTFLLFLSVAIGQHIPKRNITWFPCPEATSVNVTCGFLTVPLDYANTSTATMRLSMVKMNASKQPKQGTILLNPGGPGSSGREFLAGSDGPGLQIATGGTFDLIGFDPRGVGDTIPFSCFKNDSLRANYHIKDPVCLNSSDTAIGATRAVRAVLAKSCQENAKDTAELIGTGYVARDMMQIVDALDENGLLNYWGFSYGSALGATVAAMFPERMGKVVLDGVLNPFDYFSGRDVSQLTATDLSFDGFFTGCVANPEMCALAELTSKAGELSDKVYDLIYHLKYNPFVTGPDAVSEIIDYTFLKNAAYSAILRPVSWPLFATGLHGLLTNNVTEARTLSSLTAAQPTIFPDNGKEAVPAIRLSDILAEFYTTSDLLGDVYASNALSYRDWPFRAKGAYLGDFRVKTKNPILFVGGRLDPVTPLPNAYNASAGFEGSVVLEHGGYGHTSPSDPSLCTAKAIRAYFVNGTLPATGTKCEPLFGLFSGNTTADALALLAIS
ncbi:MAG: hypothetical protein L6R36_004547 [Xanthoria steineri]|nr:MAG: hypothetical protein L6R36_004547 [Xanthoria steineri]